jgi:hypothetical protein
MRRLFLLSTILLLSAGCVGSIGDENPGGDGGDDDNDDTPEKMGETVFKRDVHPTMLKCSSAGCHDRTAVSAALSKFYDADADLSYDAVIMSPSLVGTFSSIEPIITKIEAGHQNITYTPDEKSKILNWLSIETEERKGDTPTPTVDPKALLREWSGCMSLENFNTANMTQAWATLGGDDDRLCMSCHQGGLGFYIVNTPQTFFDVLSSTSAFLVKYFSVSTVENKVVVNTGSFENANKIAGHPTFPVKTNPGFLALEEFYTLTATRKMMGQCDQPRLKD